MKNNFHLEPIGAAMQYFPATLFRCDTVINGAENTTKQAGSLSDNEVFSRPEFASARFSRLHGFGRECANRKAARTTCFVFSTPVHPLRLKSAASGFQSQQGAETMTNVVSLARPRAAQSVQTSAQNPTFKTAPASPALVLQAHVLERQQAIENALTTALYFIRLPLTESGLKAATSRAIRAASMLKQACADSTTSGRA